MTFSNDPNQVAQGLANLWPSLVDEPPTPQDYALFMQRQAGGLASPAQAADAGASSNDPPLHLLAAQVLGDDMAGRDSGAIGPPVWNSQSASGGPAPTIGDDDLASGEDFGPDAVQALPPGQAGALPTWASAIPVAAEVPGEAAAPAMQPSSLDRPPGPNGGFYRPEFPNGLDPLPSALERTGPGPAPSGFFVDPKTGGVSRPRFGPSGDPLNPAKLELAPATPQEMQDYFERRAGARANYQPGLMSPEEGFDRALLQPDPMHEDPVAHLPPPPGAARELMDLIPRGEGADYDTVYAYGHYGRPEGPVTSLTVGRAMKFQSQMIGAQKREFERLGLKGKPPSSPIGRYQITQTTLQDFLNRGLITKDTVLTPEVQDRLAWQRLMDAGLEKYLANRLSEEQFHGKLGGIWTSIETPTRPLVSAGGTAKTSWAQIMSAVRQLQGQGR